MDGFPAVELMEQRMIALAEKDKTDFKVEWETRGDKMCLITRKSVKESDVICEARALLFSSATRARKFLEQASNAALLGNSVFVRVEGVRCDGQDQESQHQEIFAILVGAARYSRDPRDVGRTFANCVLEANPHAGPNDGFLVLRAKSHNGCGVTAGTELVLDFGDTYLDGLPMATTPKKARDRGALDLLMDKQRRSSPTASEIARKKEEEEKAAEENKKEREEKRKEEEDRKKREREAKRKETEEAEKRQEEEQAAKKRKTDEEEAAEGHPGEEEVGEAEEGKKDLFEELAKGSDWRAWFCGGDDPLLQHREHCSQEH